MDNILKNKEIIILLVIILIIISTIIYKIENFKYNNLINENIFETQNTSNNSLMQNNVSSNISKIKVHIIGEINLPGLYELDEGARINDLILLAGGSTENADLNKVNLAYELSDGEQIYIPSIFDENNEYNYNEVSSNSGKININKATVQDLQTISGLGPSLAQKIIEYRNTNGKFNSIEELKNISGIGEKKFELIKDFVSIK